MQEAVRFQVEYWGDREGIQEGDVLISNHPQLAGKSYSVLLPTKLPVLYYFSFYRYAISQ